MLRECISKKYGARSQGLVGAEKWERWFPFLVALLFLFSSCQEKVEHDGKQPLAQLGNQFLYYEDVVKELPYGISKHDSVRL